MSAQEIYEEPDGVWGKDCLKYKTIKTWALRSSDAPGPTLVENRGQVAKNCYHPQNLDAVYDMVMSVRRVTLVQIVDALRLSYGTVNTSLQIELKLIKCAA